VCVRSLIRRADELWDVAFLQVLPELARSTALQALGSLLANIKGEGYDRAWIKCSAHETTTQQIPG
jgi:hypothetical protein